MLVAHRGIYNRGSKPNFTPNFEFSITQVEINNFGSISILNHVRGYLTLVVRFNPLEMRLILRSHLSDSSLLYVHCFEEKVSWVTDTYFSDL